MFPGPALLSDRKVLYGTHKILPLLTGSSEYPRREGAQNAWCAWAGEGGGGVKGSGTSNGAAFNSGRVKDPLKNLMKTLALFSRKKKKKKVHIRLHNFEYSFVGFPDPLETCLCNSIGMDGPQIEDTLLCLGLSSQPSQGWSILFPGGVTLIFPQVLTSIQPSLAGAGRGGARH